jgi:SH3 domain-containing YSC84-like protein 1
MCKTAKDIEMRKLLLSSVISGALGLATVMPVYAASRQPSNNTSSAEQLVNDAIPAIQQAEQHPRFIEMLKQAKGIFIVPDSVKGAAVIGGEGGQGVLLAREAAGWSDPAFLSIGSISLGAQVGGKAGHVILLLMTDKALNDFTQANNFSLNANAGLTVVNYATATQAPVGKGDIVVWSQQGGAFLGADVSATDITQNIDEDHNFYGSQADTLKIIHGKVHTTRADKLRSSLPT